MREDIINYLKNEIKNRAENENNKFGIGVLYHIKAVVKNAKILADEYNADKEVCIIAAWLHDIASITDYKLYKEHHSLLYLAYKEKNMSIEDGKEFVKSKLERSFNKLSDDSKIFYEEKFKNIMKIF